ncbi:MAG TPA: glutamine-hydrolyzing carbamoyl-phosphate synthase small subunit [Bdellovibrionales bacterium]|nr:glutamine-hydrolyzing carbamoyl-phosphate synthase small subunit [Bdellovibrionales bacterium]
MKKGFLVLESGEAYEGRWHGGKPRAGEVVFNTSHSGYEEIATDPSYFSQIMVMTAPMQGNYGCDKKVWESRQIWIEGFVSLEIQNTDRDSSWLDLLLAMNVPVLTELDTREIVLRLRSLGTPWGALVQADSEADALAQAKVLIAEKKKIDPDWAYLVSRKSVETRKGADSKGPRVAVIDFGVKENTIRELEAKCSEVAVFPSRTPEKVLREWNPDGIMLSNGPGDPADVKEATETLRSILGWKPVFGICMGNQILARALGAKTYKLPFGHRGGNHPVKDLLLNEIYVTSQNHGYCVDPETLPKDARVTQFNLNDGTVEGIECASKRCFSVQYHPESHPGPHEARKLFDYFLNGL